MTKKTISAVEYLELPEAVKFDLLRKDGVHVGKRKWGGLSVILFQLYGFYVEVHYKKYRKDIDRLIVSSDTDILQPYLEQIQVRDLNNFNGGN